MAAAKCAIPFCEAFIQGILCKLLVCLAVWLALAGRNVTDRVVVILFPICALVAADLEHGVANMYFVPLGILLQSESGANFATGISVASRAGFARNLTPSRWGTSLVAQGSRVLFITSSIVDARMFLRRALSPPLVLKRLEQSVR